MPVRKTIGYFLTIILISNHIAKDVQAIIEGIETSIRNYPFMTYLTYKQTYHCGSAILDAFHVITAAQCIVPGTPKHHYEVVSNTETSLPLYGTRIGIRKARRHGGVYKINDLTYNDVALVTLKESLVIKKTPPIPLAALFMIPRPDQYVTLTGWGMDRNSYPYFYSQKLKYVNLQMSDQKECRERVSPHWKLGDEHFCVNHLKLDLGRSVGASTGDIGSSLSFEGRLLGFVTKPTTNTDPEKPDIYIRVALYGEWFKNVIFGELEESRSGPAYAPLSPQPGPSHASSSPQPGPSHASSSPQPAPSQASSSPQPGPSHASPSPQPAPSQASSSPQPGPSHASPSPQSSPSHVSPSPQPGPSHVPSSPQSDSSHSSPSPHPTPMCAALPNVDISQIMVQCSVQEFICLLDTYENVQQIVGGYQKYIADLHQEINNRQNEGQLPRENQDKSTQYSPQPLHSVQNQHDDSNHNSVRGEHVSSNQSPSSNFNSIPSMDVSSLSIDTPIPIPDSIPSPPMSIPSPPISIPSPPMSIPSPPASVPTMSQHFESNQNFNQYHQVDSNQNTNQNQYINPNQLPIHNQYANSNQHIDSNQYSGHNLYYSNPDQNQYQYPNPNQHIDPNQQTGHNQYHDQNQQLSHNQYYDSNQYTTQNQYIDPNLYSGQNLHHQIPDQNQYYNQYQYPNPSQSINQNQQVGHGQYYNPNQQTGYIQHYDSNQQTGYTQYHDANQQAGYNQYHDPNQIAGHNQHYDMSMHTDHNQYYDPNQIAGHNQHYDMSMHTDHNQYYDPNFNQNQYSGQNYNWNQDQYSNQYHYSGQNQYSGHYYAQGAPFQRPGSSGQNYASRRFCIKYDYLYADSSGQFKVRSESYAAVTESYGVPESDMPYIRCHQRSRSSFYESNSPRPSEMDISDMDTSEMDRSSLSPSSTDTDRSPSPTDSETHSTSSNTRPWNYNPSPFGVEIPDVPDSPIPEQPTRGQSSNTLTVPNANPQRRPSTLSSESRPSSANVGLIDPSSYNLKPLSPTPEFSPIPSPVVQQQSATPEIHQTGSGTQREIPSIVISDETSNSVGYSF